MPNKVRLFLYLFLSFFLFELGFIACKPEQKKVPTQQLELMLLGLPEHIDTVELFKSGVDYFRTHKGLDLYMVYKQNVDHILLKECTTLNDMGEPNIPVPVSYYQKKIDTALFDNLEYVLDCLSTKPSGELVLNPNEEYWCDLFGLWIAVYTAKNGSKKYFLFDCFGLPDSLHNLCHQIRPIHKDSSFMTWTPSTAINTDSLANVAFQKLKPQFDARYQKFQSRFGSVKFEAPKVK